MISLNKDTPHEDLASFRAATTREPVMAVQQNYLRSIIEDEDRTQFKKQGWRCSFEELRDTCGRTHLWYTCPIIREHNNELVGTLSMGSQDEDYMQRIPQFKELMIQLAKVAAVPLSLLRARRMTQKSRDALIRVVMEAAWAENLPELGKAIIEDGLIALGSQVYLALLVHDPLDSPGKLKCIGCEAPAGNESAVQPSQFEVDISDGTPAIDLGVVGYVYRNSKPCFSDDITKLTGKGGGPVYRVSVQGVEIKANYAVPVLRSSGTKDDSGIDLSDPERKGESPLGVLLAEAPAGVLNQEVHRPILEKISAVCAASIMNLRRRQQLQNYLNMMLPPKVASAASNSAEREIETHRKQQRIIVTVLFADIRGYTEMSHIVGERRLMPFLREYYELLTQVIQSTGGTLDKLMGDGVMALYGDADVIDNVAQDADFASVRGSAENAISAGLQICDAFSTLAKKWLGCWRYDRAEIRLDHPFELGVAIHTGKPMVGFFHTPGAHGSNQPGHLTYTAVGRDVNIASRLSGHVAENSVCISGSTNRYLQRSSRFAIDSTPKVISKDDLKGIQHDHELFRVLGRNEG